MPRVAVLGTPYWRLWTSSGLSNLADGITKVALPLVAIQYTRSPALIAGIMFALTLPWLLFALPVGALADRLDRRTMMLSANTARATSLITLVLAAHWDAASIWVLFVVALGIGIAETVYDISAQTLLPQVVQHDRLQRANGRLYAVELTANEFVGPPLAGFLAAAGTALTFGTPAALWVLAVAVLLMLRGPFRIERTLRTTMRADIAEGLRFLWRHRLLRTFAVLTGVFNFATSATFGVLVLHAVGPASPLGLSELMFGVLFATIAAGGLCGSFAAEPLTRLLGRARTLAVTMLIAVLQVAILVVTTNPWLIGTAFFLSGTALIIWNIIAVSLRQRITPNRLLGRVSSGHRLVAWGTKPLGAAAGGVLAELVGLRTVFAVMALLMLTLLASAAILTDENMDAAERAADQT